MRKNKGNAKRILALTLAFALVLGNVGVSFADEISGEERIEALAEAQGEAKVAENAKGAEGAQVVEDAEEVPREKVDADVAKGEKAEEADVKALSEETASKDEAGEAAAQKLEFENDDVKITVSEEKAGVIPVGVNLKVTPIQKGDKANEEERILGYEDVEKKLNEKAAGEEYEIAGFLAYDIKLVDNDGNEVEPNGEVKVSMEYKKAVAPEGVDAAALKDADVTVMHLEENAKGEVINVVDLVADEGTEATVETTKNNEVEKVEAVTSSFSTYTISWNVVNQWNGPANGSTYIIYAKGNDGKYYALKNNGGSVELSSIGVSGVNGAENGSVSGLTLDQFFKIKQEGVIWTKSNPWVDGKQIDTYASEGNYICLKDNNTVVAKGDDNRYSVGYHNGKTLRGREKQTWNNNNWGDVNRWLNFDSNGKQFKVSTSENVSQIYFAKIQYVSDPGGGAPGTLNTVDSKSQGIKINLFDYYAQGADDPSNGEPTVQNNRGQTVTNAYINNGINANHSLKFTPYGMEPSSKWDTIFGNDNQKKLQNTFMGSGKYEPRTGIVQNKLDGGYPKLSAGGANGESLKYLFDENDIPNGVKKSYLGVNHLFQVDPTTGAYYYSSGLVNSAAISDKIMTDGKYAYFDKNTYDFTVYDGTFLTDFSEKGYQYPMGFFPFNVYNNGKTNQGGQDNDGYYNHHFGLTLEASFTMTPDKKTGPDENNRQDIVFKFSGDDDMWVFIDDVLVLDLGGVHEPLGGWINFSMNENDPNFKGNVWVQKDENDGTYKTLSQIFSAAGKTWDPSPGVQHTIKCFYLERGGQYSNLAIMINVPLDIPIEKVWKNDNEATHTNYTVDVALERRLETDPDTDDSYEEYRTATLNTDKDPSYNWKYTFSDVPRYYIKTDNNGNKEYISYVYRVVEKNIKKGGADVTGNYDLTYETDENGVRKLVNTYNGKTSMSIAKTFKNLPADKIPTNFEIKLYKVGVTKEVGTITLTNPTPKIEVDPTTGDSTYIWIVSGLETGKYYVKENNCTVSGYKWLEDDVEILGYATGQTYADLAQGSWTLDYGNSGGAETTCSRLKWGMQTKLIIAKSTASTDKDKPVYIITEEPLTTSQYNTIKQYANVHNYTSGSIEKTNFAYVIKGQDVSVNGNDVFHWEGSDLVFGGTNQWSMFCWDTYGWDGEQAGDIHIINPYELAGAKLDIKKHGTSYSTNELAGSKFQLTLGTWSNGDFSKSYQDDNTTLVWTETINDPSTGVEHDENNKLEPGDYILEETKAPNGGYCMLTAPIYLRVEDGQVKLLKSDGTVVTPDASGVYTDTSDMWKLEPEKNDNNEVIGYILRVKNELLYSLPSTGGIGIFVPTFVGALMMAFALFLYDRRRAAVRIR